MIITIHDLKQEGKFFIVDGIMQEDFIYSFRFVGNNIQNILTYKKLLIKYDTFSPSSAEFEDVELSQKIISKIKFDCIHYIANYIANKPKNVQKTEYEVKNKNLKKKETIYFRHIDDSSFLEVVFYNDMSNLFGIKFLNNDSLYLYEGLDYKDFIDFYRSDRKHILLNEIKKDCKMIKLEDKNKIKNFFLGFEDIFESYF